MAIPAHPSDPPTRLGWVAGGAFGYTDEGAGPTLLALHGLPGSARDFRWLAAALGGRVRLVRLEQPGFGATPRATEPDPTLAGRVRFALRAIDTLGLGELYVLGHSMGGPLAMGVAAALRERARGVALLASVGLHAHRAARRTPRHPDAAGWLAWPPLARLVLPGLRRGFARAGFPRSTPDEALIQCARAFSVLSFEAVRAEARALACPSLLAWTEDDPMVEPAIGLALAEALPPGPRVVFPTGGHNLQKTRAVELAAALGDWIEGERPAAGAAMTTG